MTREGDIWEIVSNGNATAAALVQAARTAEPTRDFAAMREMSHHPNIDAETLAVMAESSSGHIRELAADHPLTPACALAHLAGDYIVGIVIKVARRPDCPTFVLAEIAAHSHAAARQAVSRNSTASGEVLDLILGD